MTVQDMIKELIAIADDPKAAVNGYLKKTGGKAIGCIPVYTPEELVHAAGMLPVGIWGADNINLDLSKQYFPAFCCSVVFTAMELALRGTFDMLSGAIIPGMDDTLITFGQNWKSGVPQVPYIPLVYPQNRKLEAGVKFLMAELSRVKKRLEEISGKEITEEAMLNSIRIYNEHRYIMREFVELAASHPNTVDNYMRSRVIKSGWFMLKEEHTEKVKAINAELKKLPQEKFAGKRVVVTGFIYDSKELLDVLEENKLRIVGDDLAHETRQFRTDVPAAGSALESLARQWSNIEGCSYAYDPKRLRGSLVAELAKKVNADGVIFALLKFCEVEEYDQPILVEDIERENIPVTVLEVDQQSGSAEQIRTRVQTFAEML